MFFFCFFINNNMTFIIFFLVIYNSSKIYTVYTVYVILLTMQDYIFISYMLYTIIYRYTYIRII